MNSFTNKQISIFMIVETIYSDLTDDISSEYIQDYYIYIL